MLTNMHTAYLTTYMYLPIYIPTFLRYDPYILITTTQFPLSISVLLVSLLSLLLSNNSMRQNKTYKNRISILYLIHTYIHTYNVKM